MDAETARRAASGLASSALKAGDAAPDFILPDAHGKPVRLYSLLRQWQVVVVFYRGGWSQYCNLHLRGFQQRLAQLRELSTLVFDLSDNLLELYRTFGHALEDANGERGNRELPVPGTFLIDGNGTIRLARVDVDYTHRLDPDDVIETLKELNGAKTGRTTIAKGIKQIGK